MPRKSENVLDPRLFAHIVSRFNKVSVPYVMPHMQGGPTHGGAPVPPPPASDPLPIPPTILPAEIAQSPHAAEIPENLGAYEAPEVLNIHVVPEEIAERRGVILESNAQGGMSEIYVTQSPVAPSPVEIKQAEELAALNKASEELMADRPISLSPSTSERVEAVYGRLLNACPSISAMIAESIPVPSLSPKACSLPDSPPAGPAPSRTSSPEPSPFVVVDLSR